jgi:hypothetical protein
MPISLAARVKLLSRAADSNTASAFEKAMHVEAEGLILGGLSISITISHAPSYFALSDAVYGG